MHRTLLLLLISVSLLGQTQEHARSHIVYVDVAENKTGAPVESLRAQDFRLELGDRRIPVTSAERKSMKPRVVIVFDNSGSMGYANLRNTEIDVTIAAINSLRQNAEVYFLPFWQGQSRLSADDNVPRVLKLLKDAKVPKGSRKDSTKGRTALRDAMLFAITEGKLHSGDALLVISDAGDTISRTSEAQLTRTVFRSGVRVFTAIVEGTQPPVPEELDGRTYLESLAARSGGRSLSFGNSSPDGYRPLSPEQQAKLPKMFESLARGIANPYEVKIELPSDASGRLKIEVVDDAGKRRKGVQVFAPERLEAEGL